MSNSLKRTVSVLTSVATIMSFSGFAAFAPMLASAAVPADYGLHEGDTVSAVNTNDPDVYIVNAFGFKRLFLNPIIFSFYGHLGGFANVKSVSAATRDAFPTSGLFRNCESNAQAVWAVEVTGEDTGTFHHVAMTGDQAVAQDPQFFNKVFCINNNEEAWYSKSSVDYTSLSQIPVYSRVPGSTPTPTPLPNGPISVSLASDNPASGTLVKSQAAADLAHFMFTGNATVNSLKFNRIGVSADADLVNVYLYDGVKRLTDAATVSSGVISFNDSSATGLFQVIGSRNISVRSDLSSSSGETVGVQLIQVNGNPVNISGNIFTVANAALATVVLANVPTPSANGALDPASDTVIFQDTATVGTRFVWLRSFQIRVIGSVFVGDLKNFRLLVDGVQQGAAVVQTDANGYVVFDLSGAPVRLETGGRVLKVLADVVNGSSRNFTVSVRQAPDVFTIDSQYNQPVLTTVATGSFPDSAGLQTISSGTLTVTKKSDSPSGDTIKGASGVTLARFELKANGERMKVENLRANVTYTSTTSDNAFMLRNGALFVDGVQVGSTADLCSSGDITCSGFVVSTSVSYTQYNLGSSLVVEPGFPRVLEIRADVFDSDGTNDIAANDIITANVAVGVTNVQSLTSLAYTSVPAIVTPGNALTVKIGTITGGKYTGFPNQSIVAPKNGVKLGHFTLTAASAEDINMNTITIDGAYTGAFSGKITDMYIKVWNDASSVIYTSPTKATISTTASNSYSVNFVLPKNKTYQVEVWGNVATGATGTAILNMDSAGTTVGSSTAVTGVGVAGQTTTVANSSLTKANGSIPAARLAVGGTTVNGYAFTLQPAFDDFTLDEVYVDLPTPLTASQSGAVANLLLKDVNGVVLATATVNSTTGSASFTGLNRLLSQSGGTQTFKIDVQLALVGVNANDTGGSVTIRLDGLKFHDSSGNVTTQTGYVPANFTGNAIIDVASYPVFANQTLSSSLLSTGSKDIFQTRVTSAGTNAVNVKKFIFSVTKTSGVVIGTAGQGATSFTNGTYKLFEDGVDVTTLGAFASVSGADLDVATAGTGLVSFVFTNERPQDMTGHVYKLQVNVTATGSAPQSINTQIANPSGSATTEDYVTVAGTSASVVWSDVSAVGHNATTTDDWMNDYLLQVIATGQSVSL